MAAAAVSGAIETADVQGILASGYANRFDRAAYVLLRVVQPAAARLWLRGLPVTNVDDARSETLRAAVQIAFTAAGLAALGLDDDALASFSREFQEGMATEHRSRILGDRDDLAPGGWLWGGPTGDPVHVMLMLFAPEHDLEALYGKQRAAWSASCKEVRRLDSTSLPGAKEHFGFHDGIAQPDVEGLSRDATDPTKAGEFILGYRNEYGIYPDSPALTTDTPGADALPDAPAPGTKDFGRNGTYLVFRQLEQDVHGFWRSISERARGGMKEAVWLASKMVGRWPNGASLALHPEEPPPDDGTPDDDFLYIGGKGASDPHGQRCPIGSHVRRTNPRDSLEPTPADSLIVSRRHRILRRGRAYGPALAESMQPEDFVKTGDDKRERGLHFICLNADIARQFEFIQQTWVMSPKFEGLTSDPDPILAPHCDPAKAQNPEDVSHFTVPCDPVRRRETGLERFVRIRGGAYFFVPSLRAIRFLAARP